MIGFGPLGDRGFLARFGDENEARGWHRAVESAGLPGILDVVLAYSAVAVHADPKRTDLAELELKLYAIVPVSMDQLEGQLIHIPVLYDGEDLEIVSETIGLSREAVIGGHCGRDYRVMAIGFMPGFPYCGNLAPELSGLVRRSRPRTRVPAGSVAIVGRQTAIYPTESPGGWHLIGRTPLVIADLDAGFFPIRSGDLIRFMPIEFPEYRKRFGERLGIESLTG